MWFINGTAPTYLDNKFSNTADEPTTPTDGEKSPNWKISAVGPFWSLPEAKEWLILAKLKWIERVSTGTNMEMVESRRKNLGYQAAKKALNDLYKKYPELRI